MQQGKGVFVASQKAAAPLRERRRQLHDLAVKLLVEAAQLGSSIDEVIEIIHDAAIELETK
jgi:DNA-binding transcriptional regulator YhcF (GntR family)